ncbi:SELP, partial [Symbiodinium natans]
MEFDAVPVRSNWLDQFILEALHYPDAAVRGSHYRGDTWDAFLRSLPVDLLYHVNGNAIYNLQHPWLQYMLQVLDEDAQQEAGQSVAFDVRMANLSYDEFGSAPESPYQGDSLLVGNYAQTLLNTSFESVEFIRHGSMQNLFQDIDDQEVTLGVMAQHRDFSFFEESLRFSHPFRQVLIMGKWITNESNYTIDSARGPTHVQTKRATGSAATLLCKIAAHVTTRYLVLTDTHNILSSPTSILVDGQGFPVLPYVPAASWSCQQFASCASELDEAEAFFGVQLEYHHDTYETVYYTDLYQQHCADRGTILRGLPKYSQCGYVHGPTADGYIAWMLSKDANFSYVPRDKRQVGFRSWGVGVTAHPVDTRECSVYREADFLLAQGNLSTCSSLVEDPSACRAANCTWRPIFGSGKCIETPEVTFTLQMPVAVTTTTTTQTATLTSISSTTSRSTSSSTTSSLSTSSSITSTTSGSTSSTVTASSTATETSTTTGSSSTTTETSTTQTTTTLTFTVLPGQCPLPIAEPTVDVLDCLSKTPGETCEAVCAPGYEGAPATMTCGQSEVFEGTLPTCSTTTWTQTFTTTRTQLVQCAGGLPMGRGIVSSDCLGKSNGQTCQVVCDAAQGFQGGPVEYVCNPSTGVFDGPGLECFLPTCSMDGLPSALDTTDCANTELGKLCFVRCPVGYTAAQSVYTCEVTGSFSGTAPICQRLVCNVDVLPQGMGYDITACAGTQSGESCQVSCKHGYAGDNATYSCGLDGAFSPGTALCERKACPMPASMVGDPSFFTDCFGAMHGDVCMAKCNVGYTGAPVQKRCDNGAFVGPEANCTALTCSLEGLSMGIGIATDNCVGVTTGNSCQLGCVRGFEGVGNASMLCNIDGSFSALPFECQPIQCQELNKIAPFSDPKYDDSCVNHFFGDICTAFCESGWDISGDAMVMVCDDTSNTSAGYAEFTNRTPAENSRGPVCIGKTCTIGLPSQRGLQHDCLGKTTLETCTLTADFGFAMPPATLICTPEGSFAGVVPAVSEATCPTPDFGNGTGSTCASRAIGEECYAYCLTGYAGSPRLYQCVANATTGIIEIEPAAGSISCLPETARRLAPSQARSLASACDGTSMTSFGLHAAEFVHSCHTVAHDDVCISHCGRGYGMTGDPTVLVCDNGVLTGGALPTCTPLPCIYNLPSAVGVEHDCLNVTTGSNCTAGCTAQGFEYRSGGAEQFVCEAAGDFNGTIPSCQRVSCMDLVLESRFSHNCNNMIFQDTCGVSCAKGWTLVGWGSQYECGADRNISGVLPDCVGNPCANTIPNDQAFSGEACNGLTTGLTCEVTCKPGSTPNSATMTCDASGALTGTLPLCKPALCPASTALAEPSLAHNCEDVPFGRSCSVFCAEGYQLNGTDAGEVWDCVLDGSGGLVLTGSVPPCEPIICPSLNPSEVLVDNCSNIPAGTACEQRCIEGYVPVNASVAVYSCDMDGQIANNGDSVACVRVACNSSINLPNVLHTCDDVQANSSCYAYCRDGYEMQQNEVPMWTCATAGSGLPVVSNVPPIDGYSLRGALPVCVALPCLYNLPFGLEYTHDCDGALTDTACTVACAAGFEGPSNVWTCQPDGLLNGTYPLCLEITTTETSVTFTTTFTATTFTTSSTTFWNGTVLLSGYIYLAPTAIADVSPMDLMDGFVNDSQVSEGLTNALASLLNVSAVSAEVVITFNESFNSQAARVAYTADRAFYTQQEAENFTQSILESVNASATEEVKELINDHLGL